MAQLPGGSCGDGGPEGSLVHAPQEGLLDNMVSPASAIVLGKPPEVGTGMVHLMVDLDPPEPEWKKRKTFEF
eukprot:s3392_g6.t1